MADPSRLVPIACPTCGTTFDVGHLPPGKPTACPKCRTIVMTPVDEAPKIPAAPARPLPAPPPPAPGPRLSKSALASFIVGIAGFCVPLVGGLIGLLLAVVGFAKIRRAQGALSGTIFAVFGLLLGLASTALYGIVIGTVALPAYLRVSRDFQCRDNLRRISRALDEHRMKRGGEAEALQDLIDAGLLRVEDCLCPVGGGAPADYALMNSELVSRTGLRAVDRGVFHHGARYVLTLGGEVELRPDFSFEGMDSLPPSAALRALTPGATPTPPPIRFERKIVLDLQASTWRTSKPFDIGAELKGMLAKAGIDAVAAEGSGPDGVLHVVYEERKGRPYAAGGAGTVIRLDLTVRSPTGDELIALSFSGSTPPFVEPGSASISDALYRDALDAFRRRVEAGRLAQFVGAALGIRASLAGVVAAAVHPEMRETAMETLDRLRYEPLDSAALAVYLIVRGDFEGCVPLGAAAAGPLIEALGFPADYDPVLVAGALGEIGDASALPKLDEISRRGSGPAAAAAQSAADAIRARK